METWFRGTDQRDRPRVGGAGCGRVPRESKSHPYAANPRGAGRYLHEGMCAFRTIGMGTSRSTYSHG